jgi:cytochrome c biogenesis protein ResB
MYIKKTNIWKFFSSIKLVIWLLTIITILSLVGTFIPQNESPEFYIEKIGHIGYSALLKTGLNNIYSSWWFILFLILLSLNLATCLVNRLPLKIRSLGTFIAHLSILVIFLGALIGIIYGQKGLIKINKGEEVSSFVSKAREVKLGFSIRLDDFIYTEHIDPKEKLEICSAKNDPSGAGRCQGCIAEVPTEVGSESDIADTGYKIKVLRYLSDFAMDTATKVAVSRSAEPNNPAIEVRLIDKAGQASTFWVFARFPDMHQKVDPNFKFVYNWAGRRPKDFISKVTILKETKEMVRKDIRVNEPLNFGGYKFFQYTYDMKTLSWSGIQVVKDPGVPVVYAGFLLLIAGFTLIFYVNPAIQRR